MKEFCYTIKNAVGVHARPAGALARMAEKYDSTITIQKDGKNGTAVNLEKLLAVMKLNIQNQETVKVTIEGSDEVAALDTFRLFLKRIYKNRTEGGSTHEYLARY